MRHFLVSILIALAAWNGTGFAAPGPSSCEETPVAQATSESNEHGQDCSGEEAPCECGDCLSCVHAAPGVVLPGAPSFETFDAGEGFRSAKLLAYVDFLPRILIEPPIA